jgi:hypothetical protein
MTEMYNVECVEVNRVLRTAEQDVLVIALREIMPAPGTMPGGAAAGLMLSRANAKRLMETIDRFFRDGVAGETVRLGSVFYDEKAHNVNGSDGRAVPATAGAGSTGTTSSAAARRVERPGLNQKGSNMGTCRSCGAQVIWAKTPAGKNCPYDVAVTGDRPGGPGTKVVPVYSILNGKAERCKAGEEGHASHFSTCPNANQHSGGGKK